MSARPPAVIKAMAESFAEFRKSFESFGRHLQALEAELERLSALAPNGSMFDELSAPEPPTVLEFPIVGPKGPTWRLRQTQVDEWAKIYPGIDVLQECRKAWGWCDSHPAQRKTAKGMPAFLNSWLSRAQDNIRPGNGTPARRPPANGITVLAHRIPWVCPHVDQCGASSICRNAVMLKRPERSGVKYALDEFGIPRETEA